MNINSFKINTLDASPDAERRNIEVVGEIGAEFFILVVQDGTQKFYNFKQETFEDGHALSSNLKVTMAKKKYKNSILLPSGGGVFVVKLMALNGTTLFNKKSNTLSRKITKASGDVTITFSPFSNTDSAYNTFDTFTSVGFNNQIVTNFSNSVVNTESDAAGFGLLPLAASRFITEDDFFYSVTDTVNGTISSSTTVVVDDLTGIVVGTEIHGVSSGSLAGTPSVTSIDATTKTLTLSAAQSFANDITLTFRSYGQNNIRDSLGLQFSISRHPSFTAENIIRKTRSDSSSTSLGMDSTYGVGKGSAMKGRGIVKGTLVSAVVTADMGDSNNAVITTSQSTTTSTGEAVEFASVVNATISGTITVDQFPTASAALFLDLDRIIVVLTQN